MKCDILVTLRHVVSRVTQAVNQDGLLQELYTMFVYSFNSTSDPEIIPIGWADIITTSRFRILYDLDTPLVLNRTFHGHRFSY
jgi:hypothetical protein